jgi:hypothetical protein
MHGVISTKDYLNVCYLNEPEYYGDSLRTIYLTNGQYVVRCRYDMPFFFFGSCIDIISVI